METYRFYKDNTGWYIDLPHWEGSRADLQMVAGADTFLDILSNNTEEVNVKLDVKPFNGADELNKSHETPHGGAWYKMHKHKNQDFNHDMWLCDVTKFVFGGFPEKIYFS